MSETLVPEVLWAQRSSATDATKNYIYLTIGVADIPKEDLKLDIQADKLVFTGTSRGKTYHVELPFYAEIDPKETKINHTSRNIEMVLRKKELKEEYWPRLLKDNKKVHFLKTDFDKWVDEDEQEGAPEDDYISNMAGMSEGGFGGIDFSKLGAASGMPDLSGLQAGTGGGDSDDDLPSDDDEEMPGLEPTAGEKKGEEQAEEKGEAKIQEVA